MINIQFYSVIHTRTKCTCTRDSVDSVLYLICDMKQRSGNDSHSKKTPPNLSNLTLPTVLNI